MYGKASDIRKDIAEFVRAPRRMQVADAVEQYMRVPMGGACRAVFLLYKEEKMTLGTRASLLAENKPKLKKIKIGNTEYFIREFNAVFCGETKR